jgi:hypothetical protein
MKRSSFLSGILLAAVSISSIGQTRDQKPHVAPTDTEKLQLLSELQYLKVQSTGLNSPLARARAKAEIASALWYLDQAQAELMLLEAYKLTLPPEEEREQRRARAIGTDLNIPNETERARGEVRRRILQVAARNYTFAKQMVKLTADSLGGSDAHLSSVAIGHQALLSGDVATAEKYILDAIVAEPTQTAAGALIRELAKKDRAAADALIIKYIDRLRELPFSFSQATQRIYYVLLQLIFPTTLGMNLVPNNQAPAQPPGPAVMKAYASYVVQSLGQLIQREPGSLIRLRDVILTAGPPIKQYAPELMPAYLELERLSRGGREGNSIQTPEEIAEALRQNRQNQLDAALNRDTIDASLIEPAVRRGMFDKARKAAENLSEGDRKTQLTDLINAQEALSLLAKGNVTGAEDLAERLRTAPRILEVYSALVNRCGKDPSCKIPLLYKALNEIKAAENPAPLAPENAPPGAILTKRELDTKLSSLSKLAALAAAVDDDLARAALTEAVSVINRTTVASELGRLGFDVELFSLGAQRDEAYVRSLATGITDSLRQIAALAAIDEWKAKELKNKDTRPQPLKQKIN